MISDKTTCPKFSEGDYVVFKGNDAVGIIVDSFTDFDSPRERYLYAIRLVSGTYPPTFYKMVTWYGEFPAFDERTFEKSWIHDTKLGQLL